MKNALWGNEAGFDPLDSLAVALLVVAGERTSIVCCHWALCSLALPIAAAALDWEKPNEGKVWVVFFISRCWGTLLVAAGWPVVQSFGLHFHHCCYHGFAAQPDLETTACLCTPPQVKGVLLQSVVISAGISEEGDGMWATGCLCR